MAHDGEGEKKELTKGEVSERKTSPRLKLQLSDFQICGRLGEGSFSHVIQVVLKSSGESFALKIVDKHLILRNKKVESVKAERRLLDRLDDAGVVKLHFTFQDEASLYFGLELCPNGELYDQIHSAGQLSLATAQAYAAEIVLTLEYLRSQRVVHCDLKPENLLLDAAGHLKLADFGSAVELPEGHRSDGEARPRSLDGTADYLSPEVLEGRQPGFAADVWALGCVVYHMLHGAPPFKAASEYLTFQKIGAGDYSLAEDLPGPAADLLTRLLDQDPAQRLGAGNCEQIKSHPFFEGVEWRMVRSGRAPEFREPAATEPEDDGVDWVMSSLAASLPLQYDYSSAAGAVQNLDSPIAHQEVDRRQSDCHNH